MKALQGMRKQNWQWVWSGYILYVYDIVKNLKYFKRKDPKYSVTT